MCDGLGKDDAAYEVRMQRLVKARARRFNEWHDKSQHQVEAELETLNAAYKQAAMALPDDWLQHIETQALRSSGEWSPLDAAKVWEQWADEYGGRLPANMSDSDIKAAALAVEGEARELCLGDVGGEGWEYELRRIRQFCAGRGVDAPDDDYLSKDAATAAGIIAPIAKRVCCRYWWRRALRKMVAQRSERGAMSLGLVCATRNQAYASNHAVRRRLDQNRRNREAMENTALENEDGQRATLAELAAKSTSNKAIRRGELMTRIRGCEEMADDLGMAGIFLTLTCPSRFHSTLRHGAKNPKHDGSTPAQAQAWLCKQWARARAALKRRGLGLFGFRVAEPHHDGCTHWHALLWASDRAAAESATEVIRYYWLKDAGGEPGAQQYRVNAKAMDKGGAAGYIAKYVAKNIDDHGIDSHIDDYADSTIGPDLLGDQEIKPSMRVEAWAATWRIRQFQAIGQPPVTVWRELRRVTKKSAEKAGRGGVVHRAWVAAQGKDGGGVAADWAAYCKAQGGVMLGRKNKVAIATDMQHRDGMYEAGERPITVGVRLNWPGTPCVWSERRLWRVVDGGVRLSESESDSKALAPPRTRVNNCTATDAARARRRAENSHNRKMRVVPVLDTSREWAGQDEYRFLELIRKRDQQKRSAQSAAAERAAAEKMAKVVDIEKQDGTVRASDRISLLRNLKIKQKAIENAYSN